MQEEALRDAWAVLIAAMRNAMDRQLSPRDPTVQELARRWMDLLRRTVFEAPGLLHDYDGRQVLDADARWQGPVDRAMFDYLSAALWARHLSLDESSRLRTDGPKQREWPRLLSALREEMNRGTSVASPAVQQLVRRWESGLDERTAGDAELKRKWMTALRSDPSLFAGSGADPRLQNYLCRARLAKGGRVA